MINIKNKRNRPKTKGEIQREEWNTLNDVYSKGGHAAVKVGAHLKAAEASKLTNGASNGGKKSIKKLLQWQIDNNFRVCDLERTNEWKDNIANALKDYYKKNPISSELRKQISDKIIENNSKLTKEERSEKFSNDSASTKSLNMRKKILNMIKCDTFTTSEARKACEKYGLGNWKGFLKDKRIIKQIYKGTTGTNPSIYQKIK